MAVPTVATVSPTSGRTGGRFLVGITGTNFKLPVAPPAQGPVPKPPPTVRVWFIDANNVLTEAERVDVVSATMLYVLVPSHDPGAVSVRVANVDAAGATVPGEVVTAANAFTFKRPMLSGEDRTAERILARVVRALTRLLKREVIENVSITVHTDFDSFPEDGTHTIEVAELPSLLLVGPQVAENRFYSENVKRSVDLQDGGFAELRPSYTVDLTFTLVGLSEYTQELLNFQQEMSAFGQRNPYLYVARDPADAAAGKVRYEMHVTAAPSTGSQPNESNVRQFQGTLVVRGVVLDDADMKVRVTRGLEEVVLNPGEGTPGTGAGGDVLVGDGTTDPVTGGPAPWPVYLDPAIYQLVLSEEE